MFKRLCAMTRSKAAGDGLWILSSQIFAALALLGGTRLLTELVEPAVFGAYALTNGIVALASGLLYHAMGQAALRYYPDFALVGCDLLLQEYIRRILNRRGLRAAVLVVIAGLLDHFFFFYVSIWVWCLIGLTTLLGAWKASEILSRNASRRNRSYAALFALDAAGRIVGSAASVWIFGPSLEALLLGQFTGLLTVLAGFSLIAGRLRSVHLVTDADDIAEIERLKMHMRRFAAPLVWMPVIGWLSGLSDRYVLAGLVGLVASGMYAAAYGLASRPILMIGSISEATLRQILYAAVTDKKEARARTVLLWWVGGNVTVGLLCAAIISYLCAPLVSILLAEEYRSTAEKILPWLLFGHVPLIASQPFERLAYAYRRAHAVVLVQFVSAISAVVFAAFGAWIGGVEGVAASVPCYFSLQLVLTAWVAVRRSGVSYA